MTQYLLALNCENLTKKLLFKNSLVRQIEIASLLEVEDQKAKVQLIKGVISGSYLHERNTQGRIEVQQMDEVPDLSGMSPLLKAELESIKVISKVTVHPSKFQKSPRLKKLLLEIEEAYIAEAQVMTLFMV